MSEPAQTAASGEPAEVVPGFRRHVVDGVELVHGPLLEDEWAGGIMFRVGRADETLSTSGLSHLVEHLALQQRAAGDHANGATGDQVTHLFTTGTRDEVVAFLNEVCAHLRDLPLQRLEVEKQILRTEAASRGHSTADLLAEARYGAHSYGLSSLPEYGLLRVDADAVSAWVDQHFTSGNAVAWICGDEVPAELDLRLRPGERRPSDTRQEWWGTTAKKLPAHYRSDVGTIVASAVLDRVPASTVFTTLLANALHDQLRLRDGVSYTATAHFVVRDAKWGELYAMADALPEMRQAAIGSFVDVLARLRWGNITEHELDVARRAELRSFEQGLVGGRRAASLAHSLLMGRPIPTDEAQRAAFAALTPDTMRATARHMFNSMLVQANGMGLGWADYVPAVTHPGRLEGTEHRPLWGVRPPLVIGDPGIGLRLETSDFSLRWIHVAALLMYPDGGREIISRHGRHIPVEPELYGLSPQVMADIEQRIDPSLYIPMPPRDASEIPRRPASMAATPQEPTPQPEKKKRRWGLGR